MVLEDGQRPRRGEREGQKDWEVHTGKAMSTDILDILIKDLLKYLTAASAASSDLNPTNPILRFGRT